MNFIIIGELFTFPEGNAATNRVFAYAKGLQSRGWKVTVISFLNEYGKPFSGVADKVQYYHPFKPQKRSWFILSRNYYKILKYFKTWGLISSILKINHNSAVICYSNLPLTIIFVKLLTTIYHSKLILERSEHPMQRYQAGLLQKLMGYLRLRVEKVTADAIFCISQYLSDLYVEKGVDENRILIVPSTVDNARFDIESGTQLPYDYIAYCGSLTIKKDGVDILIEAFSRISSQFPGLKLLLIGKGDTPDEERAIRDLPEKHGIMNKVVFLGQVARNQVPQYLVNAKILALARPDSIIAEAGFPSKLTEYLATGKPVAVTAVGDIPKFLKHQENVFLAKPGDTDEFAKVLSQILSNYSASLIVGYKGKSLTDTIFNPIYQADRIIHFLNNQPQDKPE